MRSAVTRVAVLAVSVTLLLLGVPLAVVTRSLLYERELTELEVDAQVATLGVGAAPSPADPIELPPARSRSGTTGHAVGGSTIGVYDLTGSLRAGAGPARADPVVSQVVAASPRATSSTNQSSARASGAVDDSLVVAVPVVANEQVIAVVRASEPLSEFRSQVATAWALLGGVGLAAAALALLVARRQAGRLSASLEVLSTATQRVAEGDLSARAPASAIPEVDQVGRSHNAMIDRLAAAIDHERQFSADASHQLRTPLAGLQLDLEEALDQAPPPTQAALERGLGEVRRMQQTIDDVLQVARLQASPAPATQNLHPLGELLSTITPRWHGRLAQNGRPLRVNAHDGVEQALVPTRVVAQILEVLLENAHRHGRGAVTVTARETAGALALSVADDGVLPANLEDPFRRGSSTPTLGSTHQHGTGIGLALARTMATALLGRLVLTSADPTTFTLFLPEPPPQGHDQQPHN